MAIYKFRIIIIISKAVTQANVDLCLRWSIDDRETSIITIWRLQ